jgi:hypothetical protein
MRRTVSRACGGVSRFTKGHRVVRPLIVILESYPLTGSSCHSFTVFLKSPRESSERPRAISARPPPKSAGDARRAPPGLRRRVGRDAQRAPPGRRRRTRRWEAAAERAEGEAHGVLNRAAAAERPSIPLQNPHRGSRGEGSAGPTPPQSAHRRRPPQSIYQGRTLRAAECTVESLRPASMETSREEEAFI